MAVSFSENTRGVRIYGKYLFSIEESSKCFAQDELSNSVSDLNGHYLKDTEREKENIAKMKCYLIHFC